VLNRTALELASGRGLGDEGLAFVIGHELAHLAHNDFWKTHAFNAIRRKTSLQHLDQLLRETNAASSESQLRELQADGSALTWLAIAGYNPGKLLHGYPGFLRKWSQERLKPNASVERFDQARVALLQHQLQSLRESVLLFEFGSQLLELGRLDDAEILLEAFRDRFPGRAVLHNLGVLKFQQAMVELVRCDPKLPTRYFTPIPVLHHTELAVSRGLGSNGCAARAVIHRLLEEAQEELQAASTLDRADHESTLALGAVQFWMARFPAAFDTADRVLQKTPDQPKALALKAITLHQLGPSLGLNTSDRALNMLWEAERRHPGNPAILYNLATLLEELGRTNTAREVWRVTSTQTQLPLLHAEHAARQSGGHFNPLPLDRLPLRPPVSFDRQGLRDLADWKRTNLRVGEFRAAFFSKGGLEVLAIQGAVELVRQRIGNAIKFPETSCKPVAEERWCRFSNGSVSLYSGTATSLWWHPHNP
jgi:tetratricopeptide (TPR) repeat protein